MRAFLPQENPTSNRFEAMWYQPWQSGYHDILKRGFPKPRDEQAVLVELRTPYTDDFLFDGARDIPFLVSARARQILERHDLTGFSFGSVVVAKIATKGLRRRESKAGEAEDSILKSQGVALDSAPQLFSVRITGTVEVVPEHSSGKTPAGWISPFHMTEVKQEFDLWQPAREGVAFSSWAFCSDRFRSVCESGEFSNIKFVPFEEFMAKYREDLKKR